MNINEHIQRLLLVTICCLAGIYLTAQTVGLRTDKNQILIGERIEYELLITLPSTGYILDIDIPDSMSHFEVIYRGRFDTTISNGIYSLHHKLLFTSFDSGSWHIPSFPVILAKNDTYKKYMTDSVPVAVGYSPSDSTTEPRDIKPILEVKISDYFWYYIAGAALLILLLFLFLYLRKRKKKPLSPFASKISAYDEAVKGLESLSASIPSGATGSKQFYTELGKILLRYYSRISNKNLMNSTTGDFLPELNANQINAELISWIAVALRTSDAVKFAKFIPSLSENKNALENVKKAIEQLEKNRAVKA